MKKANVNVELGNLGIGEIKKLLWRLCYDPEEALKELDLEGDVDVTAVKENILQQAREKFNIRFLFAGTAPYADTFGVDLGIKDPVVRDTVLYKCYKFVENAKEVDVAKAVGLLRTDSDSEKAEARLIGGLKAIGFGNKAAKYLYETCCLYPVSLLLKKMLEKEAEIGDKEVVEKNATPTEEMPIAATNTLTPPEKKVKKEDAGTTSIYVANKAEIEKLFVLAEEKSKKEVEAALENAKKEVKRLEEVMSIVATLEAEGLTFEEVLEKKEKLVTFFRAMEAL